MNKRTSIALKMLCLGAALLFTSANSHADNGFLVFNTVAYHFENSDERNDFTPGIGWEYSPTSAFGFHVGTLSDSFGFQSTYGGINYQTRRLFNNRVRLILGASVVHKQFRPNAEPETKLLPFPVVEFTLTRRAVLNVSGSPELDFAGQKNNPVIFFQFTIGLT